MNFQEARDTAVTLVEAVEIFWRELAIAMREEIEAEMANERA